MSVETVKSAAIQVRQALVPLAHLNPESRRQVGGEGACFSMGRTPPPG
jgi:hypothetical protein